jgi:predicted esterase
MRAYLRATTLLATITLLSFPRVIGAALSSSSGMASAAASSSSTTRTRMKPLIIFCHGSGDTGAGAQAWIQSLVPRSEYDQFEWLFPSAQPIPYQLNGGMISSVWYDRNGGFDPSFPEHISSIERSTDQLLDLIEEQLKNKNSPRSPGDIVVGGFSMGGAIAYQTAARWHARPDAVPLGAVFGLSCYLNHNSKVWSLLESNSRWPPTFVAHGAVDDFIIPQWGQATYEKLVQSGVPANFRSVPNTVHDMDPGEIAELLQFLQSTVANSRKKEDDNSKNNEL